MCDALAAEDLFARVLLHPANAMAASARSRWMETGCGSGRNGFMLKFRSGRNRIKREKGMRVKPRMNTNADPGF